MPKIYNDFLEISANFDVLLVDAYGVFWDGQKFYEGSREILAEMVKAGKIVCILSNTTATGDSAKKSYTKKGLIQGEHYTDFITSGDIARKAVLENRLDIPSGPILMWGTANHKLFLNSAYEITNNPDIAKSFYISIPQLNLEQKSQFHRMNNHFYESKMPKDGENPLWDSMIIDPFLDDLKNFLDKGLTAVNANPDYRAFEMPKNGTKTLPVIRQGLIAKTYREMGGKVIEFGKPHNNAYDYAFTKLGITPCSKVAMIGDTYRTDIKGGLAAGISAVWCVDTGMTKYEIENGATLEQLAGNNFAGIFLVKSFGRVNSK